MITKQDLLELREQLQEDCLCVLDGIKNDTISNICQTIVDRLKPLLTKVEPPD
jgi:hypothetical protein